MTKLLHRPLKAFAIYSLIILLISIPAYFLVVDYIWLNELDEHNQIIRDRIAERFDHHTIGGQDLSLILDTWNTLQPGTSIRPIQQSQSRRDSIYEIRKSKNYTDDPEADRFRVLQSSLEINGLPYQLTVETNVEEADETLLAIALVTFFFFVLLIVGFILLNNRIARNTWQPFYQTLTALRSFELGKDRSIELEETDIVEFQELNSSLKNLIHNNVSTYQQQKAFTENASHELQTPIALLKSKLDLLLQQRDITPEISAILASIEVPLSRLSRINKNLLLLAKVENQQYEELETMSVADCLNKTLDLFEDYLGDRNLTIVAAQDQAKTVLANPFLLETLLNNLLSNAIRHSPVEGKISIHINQEEVVVANTGSQTLDPSTLFKRFSTTSQKVVGSGLGLAIVKEITNRYGWEIKYSFQNKMHTFSLAL